MPSRVLVEETGRQGVVLVPSHARVRSSIPEGRWKYWVGGGAFRAQCEALILTGVSQQPL